MDITFVRPALAEALGWTLLHSLWQGLVVLLLLSLALRLTRTSRPKVRYRLSIGALLAFSGWIVYTFFENYSFGAQFPDGMHIGHVPMVGGIPLPEQLAESSVWWEIQNTFHYFVQAYARELASMWLLGTVLFMVRWMGSMYYTYQLRTTMTVPAMESWQNKVHMLGEKLGVKQKIQLFESARIEVPLVVGHIKPVILFPIGMLTGLAPEQVEAILAHELAHIKRYDFLVNLLLSLVEIILFYHPVYWWISSRIREEREHCCDDMAVSVCGNAKLYAKALMEMEALLQQPTFAMAFTGKKNHLLARIKRVCLGEESPQRAETGKIGLTLGLLMAIGIFAWFRLPAQDSPEQWDFLEEEGAWLELDNAWEEIEIPVPEIADVEELVTVEEFLVPPEIQELNEALYLERVLAAVIDTPPNLPPMPPIPPTPAIPPISPMPAMPAMPTFPTAPSFNSGEEWSEWAEKFQESMQSWEEEYKVEMEIWEQEYVERFEGWEEEYKESFEQYEEDMERYLEAYEGFDQDVSFQTERAVRRQMEQAERAMAQAERQLELALRQQLIQQEQNMAQTQRRIEQEMLSLQQRLETIPSQHPHQKRVEEELRIQEEHLNRQLEKVQNQYLESVELMEDLEVGLRAQLMKEGLMKEAEAERLTLEYGKKGMKVNGKLVSKEVERNLGFIMGKYGIDVHEGMSLSFKK